MLGYVMRMFGDDQPRRSWHRQNVAQGLGHVNKWLLSRFFQFWGTERSATANGPRLKAGVTVAFDGVNF